MKPIVSSETSAIKSQTPGNYPKRNKLQCSTCFGCQYIHPQELATYVLIYIVGYIDLVRCVLELRCGMAVVVWYPYAG